MRICDVTGERMEAGYVVNYDRHVKYESDLIKEIVLYLNSIKDWSNVDRETLLTVSYNMEFHYYTEWEEDND